MLKQKKLHKTSFNFEFLIHDLVGSGRVERYIYIYKWLLCKKKKKKKMIVDYVL
jgi:hypothetical protein